MTSSNTKNEDKVAKRWPMMLLSIVAIVSLLISGCGLSHSASQSDESSQDEDQIEDLTLVNASIVSWDGKVWLLVSESNTLIPIDHLDNRSERGDIVDLLQPVVLPFTLPRRPRFVEAGNTHFIFGIMGDEIHYRTRGTDEWGHIALGGPIETFVETGDSLHVALRDIYKPDDFSVSMVNYRVFRIDASGLVTHRVFASVPLNEGSGMWFIGQHEQTLEHNLYYMNQDGPVIVSPSGQGLVQLLAGTPNAVLLSRDQKVHMVDRDGNASSLFYGEDLIRPRRSSHYSVAGDTIWALGETEDEIVLMHWANGAATYQRLEQITGEWLLRLESTPERAVIFAENLDEDSFLVISVTSPAQGMRLSSQESSLAWLSMGGQMLLSDENLYLVGWDVEQNRARLVRMRYE